jgi:hypothetical protein
LLLGNPEAALALEEDLHALNQAHEGTTVVLAKLIEMVHSDPHIDTYTLLGYCAGSPFYAELTLLLKQEKITPVEGATSEFVQIVTAIRDKLSQDSRIAKLRAQLASKRDEILDKRQEKSLSGSPGNAAEESPEQASSESLSTLSSPSEHAAPEEGENEWARSAPLSEPPPFMDFDSDE